MFPKVWSRIQTDELVNKKKPRHHEIGCNYAMLLKTAKNKVTMNTHCVLFIQYEQIALVIALR
jgi:hypothetical protein